MGTRPTALQLRNGACLADSPACNYTRQVHGNLYGTSVGAVRKVLESGRVCILDIDVQGARAVRKTPLKAIFVFVAPPSLEDLAKRLVGRELF